MTSTGNVMNMEWTSLVDTATKAITSNDEDPDTSTTTTAAAVVLNDENNSISSAAPAPEQKHTRNINVNGADNEMALRDRVAALEEELRSERQGRQELETQIEHLKEESQTAAQQLRRFTEWFFQTIDKS